MKQQLREKWREIFEITWNRMFENAELQYWNLTRGDTRGDMIRKAKKWNNKPEESPKETMKFQGEYLICTFDD